MIFIIISLILIGIAAIGTIVIGINPSEENYEKNTKRNLKRFTVIYIVITILSIGTFVFK